jgi:hypothetical protein
MQNPKQYLDDVKNPKNKIHFIMKNSTHRMTFQRIVEHHLAKVFTTVLCNLCLLFWIAVVLKRQNHREFGSLKCTLSDSLNYFLVT